MRAEELWCGLAAFGWVVTLAGGNSPANEWPEPVRTYNGAPEDRLSDTYVVANINITYEDEHGEIYTETSESGKYGEGFVGSSKGIAVHIRARGANGVHDHTGCTLPLLNAAAPHEPLPREPWIAVIRRGSCNFEIKVQNAWRANASAVLIYNDRDTPNLEKMKLSTDIGRNISAVFTYKWKGEEITRLVDNGTKVFIGIIKGRTCVHAYNNINKTSVLFVSISFIVLMVISLAWLVFYYIQRFRYIHAKDKLSKRLCCAAKKAMSKIPVKSLKTEDREVQGDGECCAICIEPYKVSEVLRSLPCRHDFHKNCIDPWLLEHRTCPMCKMDILKYYGFVFTGSQESILQLDGEEPHSRVLSPPPTRLQQTLTLLANDTMYGYVNSERSSRASSPDELTPSLRSTCGVASSRGPDPGTSTPGHSKSCDVENSNEQQPNPSSRDGSRSATPTGHDTQRQIRSSASQD